MRSKGGAPKVGLVSFIRKKEITTCTLSVKGGQKQEGQSRTSKQTLITH